MKRNARTAFLLSRAALPLLRQSRGAIVNFASPAGIRAQGNLGAYSASKAAVVALTRYGDDAYVKELLNAGALGYVLKQSPSAELVDAVRAAASGQRYLDRNLASRVAGAYLERGGRQRATSTAISDRESEVLRLMALGHSNKDIAASLTLSVKTVEVHKANAMRKLGLAGRTEVVRYALLQGWLRDP